MATTTDPMPARRPSANRAGVASQYWWIWIWLAGTGSAAARRRQDRPDQQFRLPAAQSDDRLCDRRAGPHPADRLQRPDLARPWRLLRRGRVHGRHPDRPGRLAVLGDAAGGGARVLHRRLPVRPAGAPARGPLSGARHLRARRRRAADPQVPAHRALHQGRAGHQRLQGRSAVRPAAQHRPMDVPGRAGRRRPDVLDRPQPARQPHRPRADGHPRSARMAASTMGINVARTTRP